MLQFCSKVNPCDYLFSPAAIFISLAASIRISTQFQHAYGEENTVQPAHYKHCKGTRSALHGAFLCTAFLLQWGFVYNKFME